jgi:DNA processing protein
VKTRSSPERELRDAIAFALMPGIGCVAFREGVERYGSAASAFRHGAELPGTAEALAGADRVMERAAALSVQLLIQGEPAYPEVLLDLPHPPSLLHALGSVDLLQRRRVGIVGTRHASASGERIAHEMAGALARAGVVVVSGMALGIDAAAHRGALDAGAGTIAVLGGGVDLPYPPSHRALHQRIARDGLVLSEAPLSTRPVLGAFPRRNRIIAALSEMLIVIEAGARSGALITARIALELGRTVAAVPGPIDSPRHAGSNTLLSAGASFIGSVDEVLSLAELESAAHASTSAEEKNGREPWDDPAHAAILGAIRSGASDMEDLARSTSLSPREFATALSTLELTGRLVLNPGGTISLAPGA